MRTPLAIAGALALLATAALASDSVNVTSMPPIRGQVSITGPVSVTTPIGTVQSGTWTMGRNWTLNSADTPALTPNAITTLETPASSFPIACIAANTAILTANTRSTVFLQNIGNVDLCVCLAAASCTATMASCPGIVLAAATVAGKGDGGTLTMGNNAGKVWAGAISCGGSAGGKLAGWSY